MPVILSNNVISPKASVGSIIGTLTFIDDKTGKPLPATFSIAAHPYLTIRYPNYLVIYNKVIPSDYSVNITATPSTTSSIITLKALDNNLSAIFIGFGKLITAPPQNGEAVGSFPIGFLQRRWMRNGIT